MKTLRELNKNGPSKLFLPLLAVIFVISLSLHNHAISIYSGSSIEISDSDWDSTHSLTDCSACLLQGSIKLRDTGTAFNLPGSGLITSLEEIDFSIPSSYLILNKPSRSPPVI